jgi:hypothetical protein
MPRPTIDLEPYKELIQESYIDNDIDLDTIRVELQHRHNVTVSLRTLRVRLKTWNIQKRQQSHDSPELRYRIITLFFDVGLDDPTLLDVLQREGYQIAIWGLQRLRKEMGLIRRVSPFDSEAVRIQTLEIVQKKLEKGTILPYGRRLLYDHFQSEGHIISR